MNKENPQRENQRAAGRRLAKCAFAFLCGAPSFGLCNAEEGETLFVNGVVWTADSKQPRDGAVLVRGERIHFVGSRAESTALDGDDVAVIDIKGGMLLPGFVESHIHPGMAGLPPNFELSARAPSPNRKPRLRTTPPPTRPPSRCLASVFPAP